MVNRHPEFSGVNGEWGRIETSGSLQVCVYTNLGGRLHFGRLNTTFKTYNLLPYTLSLLPFNFTHA